MPPSASLEAAGRWLTAPVKAPFSWPKSSLSIRLSLTAAQSKTTNGPSRRGDSWWMAWPRPLAGAGLADQEERRIGGAIRSSRAKICRIGTLSPTSSPSRSSTEGAMRTGVRVDWKRSCTSPSSSSCPGLRNASRICAPSMKVPLVDWRSCTRNRSPCRWMARWLRLTVGWSMTTSLSGALPIFRELSVMGNDFPASSVFTSTRLNSWNPRRSFWARRPRTV